MSSEEQQAAMGRTMEEYVESKKKLAALQAESTKIGNSLTNIGQALCTTDRFPAGALVNNLSTIQQESAKFPTADSLVMLVRDIQTEMERKDHLRLILKNMGFEPKD
jgi:hypothetical protein